MLRHWQAQLSRGRWQAACCCAGQQGQAQQWTRALSGAENAGDLYKVAFFGTPMVAAEVLQDLVTVSRRPGANFEVCSVVTKPPEQDHAGAHVWRAAKKLDIVPSAILTPKSPKEAPFLDRMSRIAPDLCVTAAYGGMLPQALLDIPRCGTVNIHPSLLPRHRGAAPVQRALEAGDTVTGVSLAYTVLQCDAGPIIEQSTLPLCGHEQAPELTEKLFQMGSEMLLRRIDDILSMRARESAVAQDDSQATYAGKVHSEDRAVDVRLPAATVHNRVRALAASPGTHLWVRIVDTVTGNATPGKVQLLATRPLLVDEVPEVITAGLADASNTEVRRRVHFIGGRLLVPCGSDTMLEVLEVKNPGKLRRGEEKRSLSAMDFMRSLGKRKRLILYRPDSVVPTAQ